MTGVSIASAKKYASPHATTRTKRAVSSDARRRPRVGHGRAMLERGVPRRALGDQPAVLHHLARAVEAERADDAVAGAEQRHELAVVERAVGDVHVLVATNHADALDLAVVLIRPHERHRRERRRFRVGGEQQALRDVDALLGRIRPVLEPHELAVEQRVGPPRDVARGDDARRGEPGGVAHDAVVEGEAGAFEPARFGGDADTDDDDIGLDGGVVGEADALDAAVALDAVDLHVRAQIDAVVAVHGRDHVAQRGTEASHHRVRQCLQDGHVEAPTPACRCDLGADEAGTDHDDLWARVELSPQRQRVVEGPEREDVRRDSGRPGGGAASSRWR